MNLYKKIKDINVIYYILFIIFVISSLTAIYSVLTYGQTRIHSDVATASLLARSQIEKLAFFPVSWNYANGEIWTLSSNLTVMPFTYFMDNQSLARMLGSVTYIFVFMAVLIYFSLSILKNHSFTVVFPLTFLTLCGSRDFILYEVAYIGAFMWPVLAFSFYYKYRFTNTSQSGIYRYVYFVLMVALITGGYRYVAEIVLPLLLLEVGKQYRCVKEKKTGFFSGSFIFNIIWISSPVVLGLALYYYLCGIINLNTGYNGSLAFCSSICELAINFSSYFIGLINNFVDLSFESKLHYYQAVMICFVFVLYLPIKQYEFIKKERHSARCFYCFALIHNIVILLIVVFLGKTEARYLLSSIFLNLCVASNFIIENIKRNNRFISVFTLLFLLICYINGSFLLEIGKDWDNKLSIKKEFCRSVIDLGIKKGYATFWNAYRTEIYTDYRVRFGAVMFDEKKAIQYRWLVDSDIYKEDNCKTFLMLDEYENAKMQIDLDNIFGKYINRLKIDNMYFYIYDYDIANKMKHVERYPYLQHTLNRYN